MTIRDAIQEAAEAELAELFVAKTASLLAEAIAARAESTVVALLTGVVRAPTAPRPARRPKKAKAKAEGKANGKANSDSEASTSASPPTPATKPRRGRRPRSQTAAVTPTNQAPPSPQEAATETPPSPTPAVASLVALPGLDMTPTPMPQSGIASNALGVL